MLDLLIKEGVLIAPDGHLVNREIAVDNGKIVSTGTDLQIEADCIVYAGGHLVLPGIIDLHTHLRATTDEPELFAGETASAVRGGVTLVGDFAYPPGTRFELDFNAKRAQLNDQAICDYCIHTVVKSAQDLANAKSHTVKIFFTASGLGSLKGNPMNLLQAAVQKGHQVLVHVEKMTDYQAIVDADSLNSGDGRVHILHVPHQRYVAAVSDTGQNKVTMETCPHYLLWRWFAGREGGNVNPPIEPSDLWPVIKAGKIVTIGTDHCSYRWQEKEVLSLPGFPCVEELLRLMYTIGVEAGHISWLQLISLLSTGPAKVLGLYPQKGSLHKGCDADLVIFDPDHEETMSISKYGRSDFSPYSGFRLKGRVVSTFVRGREVYHADTVDSEARGWGEWYDQTQKTGGSA